MLAVIEIVSPSSRARDRRWKPEAYAEAGIGSFVRVELATTGGGPELLVFALAEGGYAQVSQARGDQPQCCPCPSR